MEDACSIDQTATFAPCNHEFGNFCHQFDGLARRISQRGRLRLLKMEIKDFERFTPVIFRIWVFKGNKIVWNFDFQYLFAECYSTLDVKICYGYCDML